MRILVAEDDKRVASFIRRGLREESFTVDTASDGKEAEELATLYPYDVMVLDLMMPKMSGFEVLGRIRAEGIKTPVIILTAKDDPEDKVKGLNTGADDYLTKPFNFDELLARIHALLRRRGDMEGMILRVGDLEMDTLRHHVKRGDRTIDLTVREYSLLEYLMRQADKVITRTKISEHVWEHDFDNLTNVIDVHIGRLRRKITAEGEKELIHTLRGRGYRLSTSNKPSS